MRDLGRETIDNLIDRAIYVKNNGIVRSLKSMKVASLFFEDSTRTRVKIETAAHELGAYVNGFAGKGGTSVNKREPLFHTTRMFGKCFHYDFLAIRHDLDGGARHTADMLDIPVISGGDYNNDHPTQALQDLMTIVERHGKLDGLKIAIGGDLLHDRAAHALLRGLAHYEVDVWLVSPDEELNMPKWMIDDYEKISGRKVKTAHSSEEVICGEQVDVYHSNRIKEERFAKTLEGKQQFEKACKRLQITEEILNGSKENLTVLDPLPIDKEYPAIDLSLDEHPKVAYYDQTENGEWMAMAIFEGLNGDGFDDVTKGLPAGNGLWQNLPIENPEGKRGKNFAYRLDNGTLIDHIRYGKGHLVRQLLGLKELDTTIVHAEGLKSSKNPDGRKEVFAIHNVRLNEEQLQMLGLIDGEATVNYIDNQRVVRKGRVVLPQQIDGLLQCQNEKCVTWPKHKEKAPSRFYVESREPLRARCHYCEKPIDRLGAELSLGN